MSFVAKEVLHVYFPEKASFVAWCTAQGTSAASYIRQLVEAARTYEDRAKAAGQTGKTAVEALSRATNHVPRTPPDEELE